MARDKPPALLLSIVLGCTGGASAARDAGSDRAPSLDSRATCPASDAGSAAVGFVEIQQIFTANCVLCHAGGSPLDLTAGVSWQNLVGRAAPAPDSCGGILVSPGDPGGSYLYQKLASSMPCYGSQMPLGEFFPEPLPSCVVAMVGRWIQEGAPSSAQDGGRELPTDAGVDASP